MNLDSFHIIPPGIEAISIYDYIISTNIFPSNKRVQKAFKRNEIFVGDEKADKFQKVSSGQKINIKLINKNKTKVFPLKQPVIYEDNNLAVLTKSPGYPVNGNFFKTLENALPFNLKPTDSPDALPNPRCLHRLDKATGGLVLAAKTARCQIELGREFQKRMVRKKYRAIVIGKPEIKSAEKNGLIYNKGIFSIHSELDNRESITRFKIISSIQSLKSKQLTLLELYPVTGRYHQLRRHLSQAGYPVLGDKKYGLRGLILKSKGLFLWATGLSFRHPILNKKITLEIKTPPKFTTYLEREMRRWKKYNEIR